MGFRAAENHCRGSRRSFLELRRREQYLRRQCHYFRTCTRGGGSAIRQRILHMKIRVAPLTSQRQFQIVEESLPEPGPGEVQVRVGAVGICGSDLHSYAE